MGKEVGNVGGANPGAVGTTPAAGGVGLVARGDSGGEAFDGDVGAEAGQKVLNEERIFFEGERGRNRGGVGAPLAFEIRAFEQLQLMQFERREWKRG